MEGLHPWGWVGVVGGRVASRVAHDPLPIVMVARVGTTQKKFRSCSIHIISLVRMQSCVQNHVRGAIVVQKLLDGGTDLPNLNSFLTFFQLSLFERILRLYQHRFR